MAPKRDWLVVYAWVDEKWPARPWQTIWNKDSYASEERAEQAAERLRGMSDQFDHRTATIYLHHRTEQAKYVVGEGNR